MEKNFCVTLAKRPGVSGVPLEEHFKHEECEYPECGDKEIVIKSLYLSVDPIQRNMMNENTGLPIFAPYEPGKVIQGLYGVGVVTESKLEGFKIGDVVVNTGMDNWPWQIYFKTGNSDGKFAVFEFAEEDPKYEITYYGLPGTTTLLGLEEQGVIEKTGGSGSGKSFVVSGAAGSCGHLAGQIARLNGCSPVIGICGTDEKCRVLKEELKFNDAINYKSENVSERLKELCPNGVDVYFDNVGGSVAETVLVNMNENGRVVLCGQISSYNSDEEYPQVLSEETALYVKKMNIQREAFVSLLHREKFARVREDLHKLRKQEGGVVVLETMHEGLEKMPYAFCTMMSGSNVGKQIVKVADL